MALGYMDGAKDLMLDALAAVVGLVSLHTGDPGTTGENEVVGGGPAYGRLVPTWNAASGGALTIASIAAHNVPAGTTVTTIGFWTDGATPVFRAAGPAGTFVGVFSGEESSDVVTLPGHGLSNGATVALQAIAGRSLPTGLAAATPYFVRDATTDTLKLAASSGGAAIDLTADGTGILFSLVRETFATQGTYQVQPTTAMVIR